MLRGLTARQFQEWLAYAAVEPFDEVRADYRAAQIAQMVLLVNLAKGAKIPTLEELVLKFEAVKVATEAKPDWQRMKAITQMIAAAYVEE
jgi:hypothetical protein